MTDTQHENMAICTCDDPEYALCTPVAMSDAGRKLFAMNPAYIGEYVCWHCGGIAEKKPDEYDHITGETVLKRLVNLDIIPAAHAGGGER